ncbi:TolC family protein [Bacteriovorax sp. BSW11_IV]|uniref:TolC family protein n=1 Tax=Bacteriovorax sp. BSW11_IV TaxID=1353529 RepID=UPI0012DC6116|nr:TolC family protein [Bacteriovorax sp. BSW11_IV]
MLLLIATNANAVTVEEALKRVEMNEDVLIANEKVKQVRNNEDSLLGNILPDISLNGAYTKYSDGENANGYDAHNVYLQLVQPLFKGLKEFNALSAAKLLSKAEQNLRESVSRETKQKLVRSIFSYLQTQKELSIHKELLKISNERVLEIERRARIGKSKKSDIYSAKAQAFSVQSGIKDIENTLMINRLEIARLIRLTDEETIENTKNDNIKIDKSFSVDDYPTLIALDLSKQVVEKQIKITRGDHAPTINLKANYYLENSNVNSDRDWDAGITLTFPIYQGGKTSAAVTDQYINLKRSEIEIVRAKKAVAQIFDSLNVDIESGKERLELNEKAMKANKLNYEEAVKEYSLGLITNLDVISAMNQYIDSQKVYARTYYSVLSSKYQLKVLTEK